MRSRVAATTTTPGTSPRATAALSVSSREAAGVARAARRGAAANPVAGRRTAPAIDAAGNRNLNDNIGHLPGITAVRSVSKPRRNSRRRVRRGDHGNDLEFGDVAPVRDPFVEQTTVLALHHLETAPQILGDPAAAIRDAGRHQAPLIAKAPVDRHRIAAAKRF